MADFPDFSDIEDWAKTWVKMIFFNNDERVSMKMGQDIPSKLYKYKAADDKALNQIRDQNIFLASPKDFNDPYDTLLSKHILYKKGKEIELKKGVTIKPNKFNEVYNEVMNKLHCSANVSALSKKYDNILMWSYYNQHKGICIEYDINCYYADPEKDNNGTPYYVYPVIYTDDFDSLLPFLDKLDRANAEIDGNVINLLAVLKTKAWQHENEWRFFNWTKNMKSKFIKIPVSKVYCGVTISNNFKKKAIRAAKSITCPVVQMELSRDEFGLIEGDTLYSGNTPLTTP